MIYASLVATGSEYLPYLLFVSSFRYFSTVASAMITTVARLDFSCNFECLLFAPLISTLVEIGANTSEKNIKKRGSNLPFPVFVYDEYD